MAAPTLTPGAIRADVITRLTGNTAAGARVYDSRKDALDDEAGVDIPAVCVYTQSTRRERHGLQAGWWKATIRVTIVGYVTGNTDAAIASNADAMEMAIVDTLLDDEEWTTAFEAVEQVDVNKPLHGGTKVEIGEVGVAFEVKYHEPHFTVAAVDLDEVAVTTDTKYPDGADVSERIFEVDQT